MDFNTFDFILEAGAEVAYDILWDKNEKVNYLSNILIPKLYPNLSKSEYIDNANYLATIDSLIWRDMWRYFVYISKK